MTSTKYIGLDVHKESISIAVLNFAGKVVMECVIETKASTLLQFIHGLRGDLHVTFEEGTWAGWLYDLLKPHVTELVVCNPRKIALLKDGSKSDRIDAHKLADLLYMNKIKPVYHGEHGLRMLKELSRSYLTITKDLGRVMNRLKALYRSWAIPCAGTQVYAPRFRSEWLSKITEAGVRRRAELYYQQLDALRLVRPKDPTIAVIHRRADGRSVPVGTRFPAACALCATQFLRWVATIRNSVPTPVGTAGGRGTPCATRASMTRLSYLVDIRAVQLSRSSAAPNGV